MKEQIDEMAECLIDIQRNFNEYCAKPCRECELGGIVNCENHYKAEALYNAGYHKQSAWISVEDRLPEESKSYLCYGFWKDDGTRGIYIVLYSCCEWMSYSDFVITHWMPLPEPPEMKGGAE